MSIFADIFILRKSSVVSSEKLPIPTLVPRSGIATISSFYDKSYSDNIPNAIRFEENPTAINNGESSGAMLVPTVFPRVSGGVGSSEHRPFFEDIPLYNMSPEMVFDGIGFYGPIIVIVIISISLQTQQKYMWVYLGFIVINNWVNRWLKLVFLESRPTRPIPFSKYEKYTHAEMYGMPSGHASAIGFSIIYLLLVKGFGYWAIVCICIGILTMYQRWKYRRHTVEQVAAGLITGSIFGWGVYTLATKWILWL
jgi:membrane-associated phospholipid phosphatase